MYFTRHCRHIVQLKSRGYACVDALDASRGMLEASKKTGVYTEYICDTLDEHQTKIEDSE